MRRYPAILSSTHVDSQGEHPTRSALQKMARSLGGHYFPLGTDHDPRLPPLGRIASAEVKILEDGHHALQAVLEVWEDGDDPAALQGDGRTIPPYTDVQNNFDVFYDVPAATDLGLPAIQDLAAVAGPGAQPFYHAKKAVDPLSAILIAVGIFIVGGIAQGFFGKIGSDAAEAMKRKLKAMFKNKAESERLLVVHAGVRSTTGDVVVDLILTNPTESDITALFDDGFRALDRLTKEILEIHPNAAKIVMEMVGNEAQLLFWVREDGVPSLIQAMASDELLRRGLSFSGAVTRSDTKPSPDGV